MIKAIRRDILRLAKSFDDIYHDVWCGTNWAMRKPESHTSPRFHGCGVWMCTFEWVAALLIFCRFIRNVPYSIHNKRTYIFIYLWLTRAFTLSVTYQLSGVTAVHLQVGSRVSTTRFPFPTTAFVPLSKGYQKLIRNL